MALGEEVLSVVTDIIENVRRFGRICDLRSLAVPYKDPEKEKERQRRRRGNPQYQEYQSEYQKQWRSDNPDKMLGYSRSYRQANPEKVTETKQRHRARNLEKVRQQDRTGKRWQVHGMRPSDWARRFAEQDGLCCYCHRPLSPDGGREVVVDHDHSCCGPKKSCSACQRGLAHSACNKIIGLAYEDPDMLEEIAASLRTLSAEARVRIAGKPVQGEFPVDVTPLRRKEAG
jgi:Recombination endonuclease VII